MLISALLGVAIGLVMALTGAGGGILAVPLLTFGAGLAMTVAAPIGLLAVSVAAAIGASLGLHAHQVRYRAALLVALCGMALAPAGLWLAQRIDNRWLSVLFSFVLFYVAFRGLREAVRPDADSRPAPPCVRDGNSGRFIWTAACARVLATFGAVAGLLSGLLGVGGGFVIVPSLRRYTDLAMSSVVATSLAVTALITASGVFTSALAGTLNWAIALPFTGGAVSGMLAGRAFAARLSGPFLQKAFAVLAAMVAFGMMLKALL